MSVERKGAKMRFSAEWSRVEDVEDELEHLATYIVIDDAGGKPFFVTYSEEEHLFRGLSMAWHVDTVPRWCITGPYVPPSFAGSPQDLLEVVPLRGKRRKYGDYDRSDPDEDSDLL